MIPILNSNKLTLKKKSRGRTKTNFTQESVVENGKTYTVKTYSTSTRLKSVGFSLYKPVVYYWKGKIHRELGPAVEAYDTNKIDTVRIWFKEGKKHNDFGAAVKVSNGDYVYYKNGKIHRPDNLPALENDEKKEYYFNGRLHRTNGPALEFKPSVANKQRWNEFWIHGNRLTSEAAINMERHYKLDDILSGENITLEMCKI